MSPPRIALFGLFGVGNLGNDGSLQAMIDELRCHLPEVKISCICPEPIKVSNSYQIPTVSISMDPLSYQPEFTWFLTKFYKLLRRLKVPNELASWYRIIRYLCSVDVMIIPGTGILDDFGVTPFQMPYDIFKWCFLARICRTKIYFVSIGAGPIRKTLSRWFMKLAARIADYRSYRDQISKDFMEHIGIRTRKDQIFPDLVFGLKVSQAINMPNRLEEMVTIGVGAMAYFGWRDRPAIGSTIYQTYVEKLSQFILIIINLGFCVRLLIGDTIYDQKAVDDILKEIGKKTIESLKQHVIYEPIHSINDLFHQISKTDIVVATRFHNVVCSLMLGKPAISIGYAKKNKVLLAEMGLGEYYQFVEQLDVNRLIEQVQQVLRKRDMFEQRIRKKNLEFKEKLCTQNEIIFQQLQKRVPSDFLAF